MSCEHGSNSILGVSWNDRIVSVLLEISLPLFGMKGAFIRFPPLSWAFGN
jgi:hypothetical protein